MKQVLRCQCGQVQGEVDTAHAAGRAVCYCKDCQAFAWFLGRQADMLNAQGGTEIVACLPRAVTLSAGADRLACMSLSEQGMFRWYASCCHTAIGNTPRSRKMPYIGLVRSCLPGPDAALDQAFGPSKIALQTGSANGKVEATPLATFFGILKIMRKVITAKLSGAAKENLFFKPGSDEPVAAPHTLKPEERNALKAHTA